MLATPKAIWDELFAAVPKDGPPEAKDKAKVGGLVKNFRKSLRLTPTQCAELLVVSAQTIHRWERGDLQLGQVTKLKTLIDGRFGERGSAPGVDPASVALDGLNLAVRPFSYIMEREKEAENVWIFKCHSPFLSGSVGNPRFEMVDIVRRQKKVDRNLYFNFVFANEPRAALESFESFHEFLKEQGYADVRDNFRGFRIDKDDAKAKFGLVPAADTAWVILLYHSENWDKLRRQADIFLETPVAILMDPIQNRQEVGEKQIWIELPSQRVDTMWKAWKEELKPEIMEAFRWPKESA